MIKAIHTRAFRESPDLNVDYLAVLRSPWEINFQHNTTQQPFLTSKLPVEKHLRKLNIMSSSQLSGAAQIFDQQTKGIQSWQCCRVRVLLRLYSLSFANIILVVRSWKICFRKESIAMWWNEKCYSWHAMSSRYMQQLPQTLWAFSQGQGEEFHKALVSI